VVSLFAIVSNKYLIDSSLPESITFTLADALHGITIFFMLVVVSSTACSLMLVMQGKIKQHITIGTIAARVY